MVSVGAARGGGQEGKGERRTTYPLYESGVLRLLCGGRSPEQAGAVVVCTNAAGGRLK